VLDEILAPDFGNHDPANPPDLPPGREGFKRVFQTYHTAFPDTQIKPGQFIAEGDLVSTRFTATGTHKGDLAGIAPTGKRTTLTGTTTFRVANGKLAEHWINWDTLGLLQQIGAVPTAAQATDTARAVTNIRRVIEDGYNKGQLSVIDEVVAPSYRRNDPASPGVAGPSGLKELITSFRSAFPDLKYTIDDIAAAGDKVVLRTTIRGTHKGEFRGIAPTGKRIEVSGLTIVRCVDGKAVESWHNSDYLGLMRQLGVIATPAGVKA
jgi:steroid delta-isomerase-like uncharacterized protein